MSSMKCTAGGWTVLTHACSASYNEPCPEGWIHHGARCFHYFTIWRNRRQAEISCLAQPGNGTLFQVRDVADQVMLRRFRHRHGDRSVKMQIKQKVRHTKASVA
ncbi:nkg2-d type ii integral membrane protein [Plakobranchus ocellatus]|uniref:Nkg2-d type ii integral membrane protein n=1 Tax=Plakobranchus ocellatus TaxID=259542 RepID=A0AAV4BX16_9GAST|nr:nkg2-d type ii integral membrane protein [Plakobranchus ocellatus]